MSWHCYFAGLRIFIQLGRRKRVIWVFFFTFSSFFSSFFPGSSFLCFTAHKPSASFIQALWSWWWSTHPKQNFMTFHYPRGEFVGIGKQPKILCIHFYLTFFALLDQRPRSDSLLWFLMRHPISSTLSQFFSRVDPFPVFLSALLSKQLLPAIY